MIEDYLMFIFFNNPYTFFNPLNAELNPICHLQALLGAHHILHFSRIRVVTGTSEKTRELSTKSRAGWGSCGLVFESCLFRIWTLSTDVLILIKSD
jgi:hypothetical protein